MFDKCGKNLPLLSNRPRRPGGRPSRGRGAIYVALAAAALASAPRASDAPSVQGPEARDWLGDWYVLIHYSDETEDSPGELQWDDEIWRIEPEGPGLRWTIFPHPEFRDPSGRWQTWPSGEEGRSSGAWDPRPRQLDEIAKGLAHAAQDERSKRLRAASGGNWVSVGRRQASSASQIGYFERWRIESAPPGPVFEREAAMASGRTLGVEATTRFVTRERIAGGRELRGDYTRQGEHRGSFRMLRMGEAERRKPAP